MTIDYIRFPIAILQDKRLSWTQRAILSLVMAFGEKGCSMGNPALAELLGIESTRVSKVMAGLKSLGLVRIVNPQSKYRRIYFGEKAKVNDESTLAKKTPTLAKKPRYFGEKAKHKVKEVKEKGLRPSASADTRGEKPTDDDTDYDLYDACAQSLTRDADPAELDEIFKGMPQ
jgi:hypothetical protein